MRYMWLLLLLWVTPVYADMDAFEMRKRQLPDRSHLIPGYTRALASSLATEFLPDTYKIISPDISLRTYANRAEWSISLRFDKITVWLEDVYYDTLGVKLKVACCYDFWHFHEWELAK